MQTRLGWPLNSCFATLTWCSSMDGMKETAEHELRRALASQYHAALAMLKQTIENCPETLWTGERFTNQFWQVAYHALFYAHLYLQKDDKSFIPWEHARPDYQFLGPLPWPPHDQPKIGQPYSKAEVLAYWSVCDAMIEDAIEQLDLAAPECGFWWYRMGKLEHQLTNIRHIQHHTGQLADRLRWEASIAIDWIGGSRPACEAGKQ
jgi:hypothetical protein